MTLTQYLKICILTIEFIRPQRKPQDEVIYNS